MPTNRPDSNPGGPTGRHFDLPDEAEAGPAWEEIESGRFMPRRVRGSCVGRALG